MLFLRARRKPSVRASRPRCNFPPRLELLEERTPPSIKFGPARRLDSATRYGLFVNRRVLMICHNAKMAFYGFLALAAFSCFGGRASADYIFAQSIESSTGSAGDGTFSETLGAPDNLFVQFGYQSSLTLDFGTMFSGPNVLDLFTIDNVEPATARVEVSADASTFTLIAASVRDDNGTATATFHPFVSVSADVPFRYVRITDLGTSTAHPNLGFDLDAIGVEQPSAAPAPANFSLVGCGAAVLAGYAQLRRRRRGASGALTMPAV